LKQKLKIPKIDHVQTPELQAIQAKKDQLVKKMAEMGEQMEIYEIQIESLKGGSSSSQAVETSDPTTGLSRALPNLNLKGVEIESQEKTISE
jgi:hypothetical protein